MTPLQISALMGQWFGAAIVLGAIIMWTVGINVEYKYHASRGQKLITIATGLFGIGCFIYAVGTKLLGF